MVAVGRCVEGWNLVELPGAAQHVEHPAPSRPPANEAAKGVRPAARPTAANAAAWPPVVLR
eukprot:4825479-Lingulodinium_polyedra.AAC.1